MRSRVIRAARNGVFVLAYLSIAQGAFARELPAGLTTSLGSAYQSQHNQLLETRCVRGTKEDVVTGQAHLEYTTEGSYEELTRLLSGSLSASVEIPLLGGAEGMARLASKHASTKNSMSWNYIFKAQTKSVLFDPESLVITDIANERVLNKISADPSLPYRECGDEYISRIDYGVSLIATIKIEFLRSQDRFDFDGKIRAAFDAIAVKVKGEGAISFANDSINDRSTVRIIISQVGGEQGQLSQILSEKSAECKLSNLDQCVATLSRILEYARGSFADQTKKPDQFSVLRFYTTPYANAATVKHLVENGTVGQVSPGVIVRRRELLVELNRLTQIANRAMDLIERWGPMLQKDGVIQEVTAFKDKVVKTIAGISDDITLCFKYPDKCEENRREREEIDERVLDLGNASLTPYERLYQAAGKGDTEEIFSSIKVGAANDTLTSMNGNLPLHFAAKNGKTNSIDTLFKIGASRSKMDEHNSQGMTPLCLAAIGGFDNTVRKLISYGANISKPCSVDIGLGRSDELEPLSAAALAGHSRVVRALLQLGANKDAQSLTEKSTALHLAVLQGHSSVVDALLKSEAELSMVNSDEMTPWQLAVENGHLEIRKVLENAANDRLIESVRNGVFETNWSTLQRVGARLDAKDDKGRSIIHQAVLLRKPEAFPALIRWGADINARDQSGNTALHLTALQNFQTEAQALIDLGANPDFVNFDGRKARQVAEYRKHNEMARLLSRNDAYEL